MQEFGWRASLDKKVEYLSFSSRQKLEGGGKMMEMGVVGFSLLCKKEMVLSVEVKLGIGEGDLKQ